MIQLLFTITMLSTVIPPLPTPYRLETNITHPKNTDNLVDLNLFCFYCTENFQKDCNHFGKHVAYKSLSDFMVAKSTMICNYIKFK